MPAVLMVGSIQVKTELKIKLLERLSPSDRERLQHIFGHVRDFFLRPLFYAKDAKEIEDRLLKLAPSYWSLMVYVNSIIFSPFLAEPDKLKEFFQQDFAPAFVDIVDELLKHEDRLGSDAIQSALNALELSLEYDMALFNRSSLLYELSQVLQLSELAARMDLALTAFMTWVLGDVAEPNVIYSSAKTLAALAERSANELISAARQSLQLETSHLILIPALHMKLVKERLKRGKFWFDVRRLSEPIDWDLIGSLSPYVRMALVNYMQGRVSISKAARMAGLSLRKFDEIRASARVPLHIPGVEEH